MAVLVTGASGFVGRHLVSRLTADGVDVVAGSRTGEKLSGKFPTVKLDVTQEPDFLHLPSNIDSVIHLAAQTSRDGLTPSIIGCVNVSGLGTYNLLNWCLNSNVRRVVYASTQMVYGAPEYSLVDELHSTHPHGSHANYAIGKLLGEVFCNRVRADYHLSCIALRFSRIYGCGESPGFVITRFIERARASRDLTVYGEGKSGRDLLYVGDAVAAIILALMPPQPTCQGIYNIGSGRVTPIRDLAETIARVFSESKSRVRFDMTRPDRDDDFCLDITKAQRELGFIPEYSLEGGMTEYRKELECLK